jgi:hypothetical protein
MILKQLNFIKLSVRQRQQVNLTCIYACPMKGRIYIYLEVPKRLPWPVSEDPCFGSHTYN